MAILLFGATGMLGQAIAAAAARRGLGVIGVARHGADRALDLAIAGSLEGLLDELGPEMVINAAAVTSLDACERDPDLAYAVNARAVALMSAACRAASVPLVQVSTDHFYTGDRDRAHAETDPVALVNEYARTKFAAEAFAALAPGALILRTNVTGLRGWPGRPTFVEWALEALTRRAPLSLFEDFHTSTLDTASFAGALFELTDMGAAGIVNLASRTVSSKRRFVQGLAGARGLALDWDERASVRSLATKRAESLGLDVAKAEHLLGRALPDATQVCRTLVSQWEHERCATLPA
jgi:dTDP-4-dehydrorhamnose reductase